MKENIKDKLTRDIFKDFIDDELPDNFTNKIMEKVKAEKSFQQTKAFNPNAFIPAFVIVFTIIVLGAIFIPESTAQANQDYYLFSDFFKQLKISFPDFTNTISQLFTNSVIFKVLPFSVILLLMLEMLLSKNYQ
ncbi:MAG: hypothetical protein L3J74_18595 [Bacteroidales bacterium]|nr:hypothetical protein [Bacteroidales bacterium]